MTKLDTNNLTTPKATRYQQITVRGKGGIEFLSPTESDLPAPKADEVRVKILAAGVA